MYTNTNPAELYNGTTWELITSDKYIRTGSTPLSTGGSNSVSIVKANLPNIKLKVDSHSHTQPAHTHKIGSAIRHNDSLWCNTRRYLQGGDIGYNNADTTDPCISAGGENTGSSTPSTEALGSGTALSIQPSYITLKFWKRLS